MTPRPILGRAGRLRAGLGALLLCASFSPPTRFPAPPPALASGHLPPDAARFLDAARAGTQRYRSQQAAIDDGFTRVGGEFPAMGEHWVSFARVMENTLAADRPSILIYATGADRPRLAGVAYTALRAGGEAAPRFPFPGAWHPHNGAVDEESLPLHHVASAALTAVASPTPDQPQLFVLHAWVWAANPDGAFVTDNWALPFARLGAAPPAADARGAACALALANDRGGYYRTTVGAALGLVGVEDAAAARTVAARRARAAAAAQPVRRAGRVTAADARRLAAECDGLWADLEEALPRHAGALRRLRAHM